MQYFRRACYSQRVATFGIQLRPQSFDDICGEGGFFSLASLR